MPTRTGFRRPKTAFVANFVLYLTASRASVLCALFFFFCPTRYFGIIDWRRDGENGKKIRPCLAESSGSTVFVMSRDKKLVPPARLSYRVPRIRTEKKEEKQNRSDAKFGTARFANAGFFPGNFRNYYCRKRTSTNGIVVLRLMNFIKKKNYIQFTIVEKKRLSRA